MSIFNVPISPLVRACFLAVALAFVAYSQTTLATITGTVTDPSGLAVANAHVQAVSKDTGYKYEATTNENGVYTLAELREGTYTVTASSAGFQEIQVPDVHLVSRDVRRIDMKMTVGTVATTVDVSAGGATLVETETARISQTREVSDLQNLPLNTRGLNSFFSLTPSVTATTTVTATLRFNGSRRNQSDIAIDGISLTAYNGTQIGPLYSYIESFQEVRMDTANNTAENGPMGQVTVTSKSGTNQLHGSAFDYYQSSAFYARNPFSPTSPSNVRHWPGGSIGGPVVIPHVYDGHDKTFFFGSFETNQGSQNQQLINPSLPLVPWRTGDFSASSTKIIDPTTNAQFQGNMIPPSRLNPVSLKIQNIFYPLPNFGDPNVFGPNYRVVLTYPFQANNYWIARVDHRLTEKAYIYGRYTWDRQHTTSYDSNLPTVGTIYDQRDTRAAVVSWSEIISPTLTNELRYGYAFTNEPRGGARNGLDVQQALGYQGLLPNLPNKPGILNVNFSGLGVTNLTATPFGGPDFYNQGHQIQEQLSWFHNKHSVIGGAQISHYRGDNLVSSTSLYGNVNFSNQYTGFTYADFLLGLWTSASLAGPPVDAPFTRWAYDFFVTDEYKVTPKLTLNLGLRYELHPNWSGENGLASAFDVDTGKIVVPDGSVSKVNALFPATYVGIQTASSAGYQAGNLIKTDKNNIAPRFGLAWRPFGEKTVIRSGLGIYYDVVPTFVNMGGVPYTLTLPSITNPKGNPNTCATCVFFPYVYSPNPTVNSVSLPNAVREDLRIPYSFQYNFTIEQEIANMGVRVSYIGTQLRSGEYMNDFNQPLPSTVPYVLKPRQYRQYPTIPYVTNGATNDYNGLNVEVKRRMANGLLYDFSYVWARDIGTLERDQIPENAYDLNREKAVWEDTPKHRLTGDFIYQLPLGKGKRWLSGNRGLDLVFGGWSLSGSVAWNTGLFLTPLWTGPDPTNTRFSTSTTPVNLSGTTLGSFTNAIRPNALFDPNLPDGQRSINRWFNVGAFTAPTPGTFGNAAKGIIVGPGSVVLNSGLAKTLALTERLHLRAEFTATNVLNHPNYSAPSLVVNNLGTAGVITNVGTAGGSNSSPLDASGQRTLRAGVRLDW